MKQSTLDLIKEQQDSYRVWIETNDVQLSSDFVSPLIPEFKEEFPTVNLYGCKECVIDMLRWALSKLKQDDTKTE